MANNPDGDQRETFHEVPASKYWYLGDTIGAVPKTFLKTITVVYVVGTFIATTILWLTNWWQLLAIATLNALYIQYWFIGWPASFLIAGIIYYRYSRRHKRMTAAENEKLRRLRLEDAQIKLAEQGVKHKE